MKLHDARTPGQNTFTAYGDDYIAVNGKNFHASLIVTPEHLRESWPVTSVSTLDDAALAALDEFAGCIVLLGTGPKQKFPGTNVLRALSVKGLAVEVMDSFAACRTFNILASEGRKVVAALILPGLAPAAE